MYVSGKQGFVGRLRNKLKNFCLNKNYCFVLVKLNDVSQFTYYVLRIKNSDIRSRIREIQDDYEEAHIILTIQNPNNINWYNSIKEEFKGKYYMICIGNHFHVDLDELSLIKEILKLTK